MDYDVPVDDEDVNNNVKRGNNTSGRNDVDDDDMDAPCSRCQSAANVVRRFLTQDEFEVEDLGDNWAKMRGCVSARLRMTSSITGRGGGGPSNTTRH